MLLDLSLAKTNMALAVKPPLIAVSGLPVLLRLRIKSGTQTAMREMHMFLTIEFPEFLVS